MLLRRPVEHHLRKISLEFLSFLSFRIPQPDTVFHSNPLLNVIIIISFSHSHSHSFFPSVVFVLVLVVLHPHTLVDDNDKKITTSLFSFDKDLSLYFLLLFILSSLMFLTLHSPSLIPFRTPSPHSHSFIPYRPYNTCLLLQFIVMSSSTILHDTRISLVRISLVFFSTSSTTLLRETRPRVYTSLDGTRAFNRYSHSNLCNPVAVNPCKPAEMSSIFHGNCRISPPLYRTEQAHPSFTTPF